MFAPSLGQRRDRRMMERAVGLMRHAREIRIGNRAADERTRDLAGDFGVRASRERGDLRS
jgi:hypothetical protein